MVLNPAVTDVDVYFGGDAVDKDGADGAVFVEIVKAACVDAEMVLKDYRGLVTALVKVLKLYFFLAKIFVSCLFVDEVVADVRVGGELLL